MLVLLLAVQAARLLWIAAAPLGPIGDASVAADSLSEPQTASTLLSDPFFPGSAARSAKTRNTALGYTLFGIRIDAAGSSAILADADDRQASWRVGETIADGVTLHSVGPEHVLLRADGVEHRLSLQAASPVSAARTGTAARASALPSSRPEVADATPGATSVDAQQLLAQAGLRARTENGRVNGYTLVPRGGGALLRQVGLQPGDVVLAVNGQGLDPESLPQLEALLTRQEQAELTVQRDGETRTITVRMTQP